MGSTWNYRVTKQMLTSSVRQARDDEAVYSIREVYYNDQGIVNGWSNDPPVPIADASCEAGPKDLKADLLLMLEAFDRPVVDLDKLNKEMDTRG